MGMYVGMQPSKKWNPFFNFFKEGCPGGGVNRNLLISFIFTLPLNHSGSLYHFLQLFTTFYHFLPLFTTFYHFLTTFYHPFNHFLPLFNTFYHFLTTFYHPFNHFLPLFTTFYHFLTTFYHPFYHFLPLFHFTTEPQRLSGTTLILPSATMSSAKNVVKCCHPELGFQITDTAYVSQHCRLV
jgi:hypothetical protein